MTIKRKLEQSIESKEEDLALLHQALDTLKGSDLLDIKLDHAPVSVLHLEGKVWLWIRTWGDPIKARTLLGEIMDTLGVTQAGKRDNCAVIEIDDLCIDFILPNLHCKKARVTKTKVIEFCGSLDESKYDSIEYLEEGE